jgi:hypothetical protein
MRTNRASLGSYEWTESYNGVMNLRDRADSGRPTGARIVFRFPCFAPGLRLR